MVEKKRRSVCVTLGLNPESETLQRFRHRSEEKRRSVCVTFGQDPVSCCVQRKEGVLRRKLVPGVQDKDGRELQSHPEEDIQVCVNQFLSIYLSMT